MHSLSYPFPAVTLSDDDMTFLRERLDAIEAQFGLYKRRPGLLQLVEIFLKHCSPPAPDREAIDAMAHFLYVVMYFADRTNPAALASEMEGAWTNLLRPGADPAPTPIVELSRLAGRKIGAVTSARGGDLTAIAQRLRVNLSAFAWDAPRTFVPASFDEHMELRMQTICVLAYVRIWGVLAGLQPRSELRFAYTFERLESLSARASALANDLRSVERDRRDGTPNAVALLGGSTETVLSLHDEAVARLAAGIAAARAEMKDAPDALAHLEFIGSCTRGNNTSMDDLFRRYQP